MESERKKRKRETVSEKECMKCCWKTDLSFSDNPKENKISRKCLKQIVFLTFTFPCSKLVAKALYPFEAETVSVKMSAASKKKLSSLQCCCCRCSFIRNPLSNLLQPVANLPFQNAQSQRIQYYVKLVEWRSEHIFATGGVFYMLHLVEQLSSPMIGFEPRTSVGESDCTTSWPTTTGLNVNMFF